MTVSTESILQAIAVRRGSDIATTFPPDKVIDYDGDGTNDASLEDATRWAYEDMAHYSTIGVEKVADGDTLDLASEDIPRSLFILAIGNSTIRLPNPRVNGQVCNGMRLFIKHDDTSGTVTITPYVGDTIEGASTDSLTSNWELRRYIFVDGEWLNF